jgi:hypothetical protein
MVRVPPDRASPVPVDHRVVEVERRQLLTTGESDPARIERVFDGWVMLPVMAGETGRSVVHGSVHYRTVGYGARIAVLPATCRTGRHRLGVTGYRATEGDGVLRLRCDACAVAGSVEGIWYLRATGPVANLAELDDGPYVALFGQEG